MLINLSAVITVSISTETSLDSTDKAPASLQSVPDRQVRSKLKKAPGNEALFQYYNNAHLSLHPIVFSTRKMSSKSYNYLKEFDRSHDMYYSSSGYYNKKIYECTCLESEIDSNTCTLHSGKKKHQKWPGKNSLTIFMRLIWDFAGWCNFLLRIFFFVFTFLILTVFGGKMTSQDWC